MNGDRDLDIRKIFTELRKEVIAINHVTVLFSLNRMFERGQESENWLFNAHKKHQLVGFLRPRIKNYEL